MDSFSKTLFATVTCIFAAALFLAAMMYSPKAIPNEIPPEIMQQLREQIMLEQIAATEQLRVPDVSGHPEHIQRVCLMCHENTPAMAQVADGVLTDMEMLLHTLFARNIQAHQLPGANVLLITPTYGVDFLKNPNSICVMTQTSYPDALITHIYQRTAAGDFIKHECLQIRPVSWRR